MIEEFYVATEFLVFYLFSVLIEFWNVATKFLPLAFQLCCNNLFVAFLNLCRDNNFSVTKEVVIFSWICCRNRVWLPYIAETKFCVATNTEVVATYFLLLPLSLAELSITTLKSLSRQTCLGLSHYSSIFCRDKNLSFCIFYCRNINFDC